MADRFEPVDPATIDFEKGKGLVPAIVQDARTGEVLMLAYQNPEALQKTMESGEATFWSRSRQELWHKGATSGNVQHVRGMAVDCDEDVLLLQVDPAGPACHTGQRTCFHRGVTGAPATTEAGLQGILELERVIEDRRTNPPEGSYVAKLFADDAKRHKKVGEEAAELIVASLQGKREAIVLEAADLLFHTMVLLRGHGIALDEVAAELKRRVGAPRRE